MKRIVAIGLLLLLLNNMFGLSIAMLFFEKDYQSSSNIIIDDKWKIIKIPTHSKDTHYRSPDNEGLIKSGDDFYNVMHEYFENDTLYVILKSNQNAKERFLELSSVVKGLANQDTDTPQSPLSKIIKLFDSLQKIYLTENLPLWTSETSGYIQYELCYAEPSQFIHQVIALLHYPPPEMS